MSDQIRPKPPSQRTGALMLGSIVTGGLFASLLAPWTDGLVLWLTQSPIGIWVMFPEGYGATLLSGATTGITYLISWLKLRTIRHEDEQSS